MAAAAETLVASSSRQCPCQLFLIALSFCCRILIQEFIRAFHIFSAELGPLRAIAQTANRNPLIQTAQKIDKKQIEGLAHRLKPFANLLCARAR